RGVLVDSVAVLASRIGLRVRRGIRSYSSHDGHHILEVARIYLRLREKHRRLGLRTEDRNIEACLDADSARGPSVREHKLRRKRDLDERLLPAPICPALPVA